MRAREGGLGVRGVAPLGQGAAAAQPARDVAGPGFDRQARLPARGPRGSARPSAALAAIREPSGLKAIRGV